MQGQITCHQCGCAWDLHMHQTLETVKVKRTIIDQNMQKQIKTAEDAKKVIKAGVKIMQQLVKEYEEEFEVIHDVTSKFAHILIDNSNTVSATANAFIISQLIPFFTAIQRLY